ncbi:hypothetical protein HPB50_007272 [Hyalomma asiaticum]|uniref:Uncharacterized protein n=1 Tax=Hyalomma asiaticum TaxID=266040 RepID=A0ACB7RMB9_HYAAI|nr:hypothetical protein HPB50_007272 [Hyalomma asiaticum]
MLRQTRPWSCLLNRCKWRASSPTQRRASREGRRLSLSERNFASRPFGRPPMRCNAAGVGPSRHAQHPAKSYAPLLVPVAFAAVRTTQQSPRTRLCCSASHLKEGRGREGERRPIDAVAGPGLARGSSIRSLRRRRGRAGPARQ